QAREPHGTYSTGEPRARDVSGKRAPRERRRRRRRMSHRYHRTVTKCVVNHWVGLSPWLERIGSTLLRDRHKNLSAALAHNSPPPPATQGHASNRLVRFAGDEAAVTGSEDNRERRRLYAVPESPARAARAAHRPRRHSASWRKLWRRDRWVQGRVEEVE